MNLSGWVIRLQAHDLNLLALVADFQWFARWCTRTRLLRNGLYAHVFFADTEELAGIRVGGSLENVRVEQRIEWIA